MVSVASELKRFIGDAPSGIAYSATTLDEEQRRQKDEIERTLRQITELMQHQKPETVQDAPAELPPNEPATVTVAPPPDAPPISVGDPLAAAVETRGDVVQPLPVDAKVLTKVAGGKLEIEVKVGVPHRGKQLDDEALYDTQQYGEQSVVVDVGGKIIRMAANFVPPIEVRPNAVYEVTDAIKGGKIESAKEATMTLSWESGIRTIPADADGLITLPAELLPAGTAVVAYKIELSGYITMTSRFISHNKLMNDSRRHVPMSPPVLLPSWVEKEVGTVKNLRVVLKWGEHPNDLDLHCVASKPVPINSEGEERDHMYFAVLETCSADGEMRLDKDDTNGYGHETLTLDKLRPEVSYWFGVQHYSGEGNLASSDATLEVYGLDAGMLAKAGFAGANAAPFTMAVPRTKVEGCGVMGIWRGFGLTPNGSGGFALTVVNKLVQNTKVNDENSAVYLPDYAGGNDEDMDDEDGGDEDDDTREGLSGEPESEPEPAPVLCRAVVMDHDQDHDQVVQMAMMAMHNGRDGFEPVTSVKWHREADGISPRLAFTGSPALLAVDAQPKTVVNVPLLDVDSLEGTDDAVGNAVHAAPLDQRAIEALTEAEARDLLGSMLRREDELRLHPKVQAAYTLMETKHGPFAEFGPYAELTVALQARVCREHGIVDVALGLKLLRSAYTLAPDLATQLAHWFKFNRSFAGELQPGDTAPDVTLASLHDGAPTSLLSMVPNDRPTLVVAGSYT